MPEPVDVKRLRGYAEKAGDLVRDPGSTGWWELGLLLQDLPTLLDELEALRDREAHRKDEWRRAHFCLCGKVKDHRVNRGPGCG